MTDDVDHALRALLGNLSPTEVAELIEQMSPFEAEALLDEFGATRSALDLPSTPVEQAAMLMESFAARPHLLYLSERIAQAVRDVENGQSRKLIIQMPPRSGKTQMASKIAPAWILSTHPSWPIVLTSYSSALAESWSRDIMDWVGEGALGEHLTLRRGAATAARWETSSDAVIAARSIRSGTTGFGAKVLVIDDPHKDFAEAHSETERDHVWNWYLSVSNTRLHPPALTIVVLTRWHEDDLAGRLLSHEHPGDPEDWEVISFPAIAEKDDVLGREEGDPLFSPLIEETREEALARWRKVERDSGAYVWSALYQQRPAPPQGAIFDASWWRYWTTDPSQVTEDGRTVLLDPAVDLASGKWLDSWDLTFKGGEKGDFVVGQRWAKLGANRYLIAQQRGRWSFTQQLDRLRDWAKADNPAVSPGGHLVHQRLIEDAANAAAAIDTLRKEISGLKPIKARTSKEIRARAVTPEIESGNVYLPHPSMPGFEWVTDFISEFRNFPNDAHDDQVDAASQALFNLREPGRAGISVPGAAPGQRVPGLPIPGGASLGNRLSGAATMRRYT